MSETILKQHLLDIRTQCLYIIEFTTGVDKNQYLPNIMLKSAVERLLINIGISAAQIRESTPDVIEKVEGLRRAIGLRNRLAHGYDDDISDDIIWDIVQNSIPQLLVEIESMI